MITTLNGRVCVVISILYSWHLWQPIDSESRSLCVLRLGSRILRFISNSSGLLASNNPSGHRNILQMELREFHMKIQKYRGFVMQL